MQHTHLPKTCTRNTLVVYRYEPGTRRCVGGEAFPALFDRFDVDSTILPMDQVAAANCTSSARNDERASICANRLTLMRRGASRAPGNQVVRRRDSPAHV